MNAALFKIMSGAISRTHLVDLTPFARFFLCKALVDDRHDFVEQLGGRYHVNERHVCSCAGCADLPES